LKHNIRPVYAIATADINHDGKMDMVLAGNNSFTRIKFGRYKANNGVVLLVDGKNNFTYLPQNKSGLNVRGDVRSMQIIQSKNNMQLIFGVNDDSVKITTLE
jgi:enediyne biosynthesis protein E4